MKRDLKEPIQLLKKTRKFEENAILVATAINDERDNAYKYSAYVNGKNKLCREAIVCLLSEFVDTVENIEGQLSLIKFFKVMLTMKRKEIEQQSKESENK